MQIQIAVLSEEPVHLPFTYYPKMSAAIYSSLAVADAEFADDLHDGEHRNRIKMFGFSPLHSRMTEIKPPDKSKNYEGGLLFKGPMTFRVCSPWPELMNRLGEGLLKKGEIRIGSQLLRAMSAQILPPPDFKDEMIWQPINTSSIVTSWSVREKDRKEFVMPDATSNGKPSSTELLNSNLHHKWKRLCEVRPDIAGAWAGVAPDSASGCFDDTEVKTEIVPLNEDKLYKGKRHYIKKSPVQSWQAAVRMTAPPALQRLAYSCGLGEMNSMGFGLVEEGRA